MSSAGNDIVALKVIDKQRTNHNRFYSKILSDAEQSFYCRQAGAEMPFEHFVWLSWSIKESVYKYLKRTEPGLIFAPTKIIILQIDVPYGRPPVKFEGRQWERRDPGSCGGLYQGSALYDSRIFHFRSKIRAEFISTIVNDTDNFENIWWGIKQIGHPDYAHQSASVRAFVLNKLNFILSGNKHNKNEDLRIGKSPLGHPVVLKGAEEMNIPVSLAHHDHFIAYSFLLAPHSPYFSREGRSVIS